MNISVFQNHKNVNPIEVITITEFLTRVKYGTWKESVEKVRNAKNDEEKKSLKSVLAGVTVSGTFTERSEKNLIQHNGFICIDIDHRNDLDEILKNDPYTYAYFKSCSNSGYAVLVKIKKDFHKQSFDWLRNYYFDTYKGILIDPAPKNVASLRYVSFDPELFINEKSKTSGIQKEKKHAPKSLAIIYGNSEVDGLVQEIQRSGVSLATSYEEFRNLAFAVADGFGETGRDYFHACCFNESRYNSKDANKMYDEALKGRKSGISVGTFYFMAQSAGFQLPKADKKALNTVVIGKKNNLTKDLATQNLVHLHGYDQKTASEFVQKVYDDQNITLASVSGDEDSLIDTLFAWFDQNYTLKRNSITKFIENDGVELEEEDINSIYLAARKAFNIKSLTYELISRIIHSRYIEEYNPIIEFVQKNMNRGRKGIIEEFVSGVLTNTEGAKTFMKKWLIGIIASMHGETVRYVLALTGAQNSGKTRFFRDLLPKELKRFYAESNLDRDKDDELLMCQKAIVMIDELGGRTKQDEKKFKMLSSKEYFSLRAPYGRKNMDFKRMAVLGGTSNETAILNDPTGNTRVLPIKVIAMDFNKLNSIDRIDLFMQLYHEYKSGYSWEFDKLEMNHLTYLSQDFTVTNVEEEALTMFFGNVSTHPTSVIEYMTTSEIKNYIETRCKLQMKNINKFGIECTKFFGESKSKKRGNVPIKCYKVIILENINYLTSSITSN